MKYLLGTRRHPELGRIGFTRVDTSSQEDAEYSEGTRIRVMAQVAIEIPGYGMLDGEAPIVILGPNGSGKTRK